MNGIEFFQALRGPLRDTAACILVILFFGQFAHADNQSSETTPGSQWTTLDLSNPDTRYPLASLNHSSGFIPAPDYLTLERALDRPPPHDSYGLTPNFWEHQRYWLYTHLQNRSGHKDWVLHISNFGYLDPKVLVRSDDGQTIQTLSNDGYEAGTDINTIGRAVRIPLEPGQDYQVVVELTATHSTWLPYIGLMSDHHYHNWETTQDLFYKTAVGIVLGFILLALTCWLITREMPFFWGAVSALLMLAFHLEHSSLPALLWQSTYEKGSVFWVLISLTMVGQLAFAGSFLGIGRHSGRWYYAFTGALTTTLVLTVASVFLAFEVNMRLTSLNYLIVAVVILGSGVAWVRSHGSYYVVYLLGWSPMVLSILQVAWVIQGLVPIGGEITASYKMIYVVYIQVLHLLVHTVALVLRMRALRREKLKAEFLSLAKSRFIAQSSHDLAQPLHSMGVFLDYLKPHIHGQEGEKVFDRLTRSHRQMNDSFHAIMDLSKLESGVIQPEFQAIPLTPVLSRLENEFAALAHERGLSLKVQPCSLTINSDPVLLERLLRNLVSNAIKYTNQGKVLIGARRQGDSVAIQVLDTGCGISEQEQERIFDIYHRSPDETRSADGSGIGLSIVRHLSELLKHPVRLDSISGRGSRFTVTVPRMAGADPELAESKTRPAIALVFRDPRLEASVASCLQRWHQPAQSFRSLEHAARSDAPFPVLVSDEDALNQSEATSKPFHRTGQHVVLACVCEPGTPLPEPWAALSPYALPAQLRALLNTANRKQA
ncbi:sensor histidine kinase [Marinobacter nauticus]|uniref:sensor histidine kinase n=1 Tax=Marinobacter nauticus TaxID=2743 RepID=UPI001D192256|nr:sensor histidine kinase [Marinobacter nauticus]MCC4271802.1 sensor histidine kinase [Marinobacter nauticus]